MIRTTTLGQIGNQMFTYVIGKILAEKTGQMYVPDQWRNKAGEPLKWNMMPYLRPVTTMGQREGIGPLVIDCQHWFDIGNVFPGWDIEATGFFQSFSLIAPYKDKIRNEWLKIHAPFVPTDDEAVYIHVRRTDYLGDDLTPERNCQATTMQEYESCLKHFPGIKKAVIVSDDYDDRFVAKLGMNLINMGFQTPRLAMGTWDSDWLTLASCKNLIMSQSTYSFWAAFLGRPTKIVCPVFPGTFWGRGVGKKNCNDYPNLEVTNDPGKEWIWVRE